MFMYDFISIVPLTPKNFPQQIQKSFCPPKPANYSSTPTYYFVNKILVKKEYLLRPKTSE